MDRRGGRFYQMNGSKVDRMVEVYFENPCKLWYDIVLRQVRNYARSLGLE